MTGSDATDEGEWFADQAFWNDFAPIMFDSERWAEVPAVVDGIERLTNLPTAASVLDLCCGVGRHCLEFAERGYRVVGVDITESFLEAARSSAADRGLVIEFTNADARTFVRPCAFDLCVNLFTSFGYFGTAAEDLAMLRAIRASLKPEGWLVIETLGREIAKRDFTAVETFQRAGWSVESRYAPSGNWEGLRTRWIATRPGERRDREFVQRLYDGPGLVSALKVADFESVALFGAYDGSAYDGTATHLIAVARPPT